jgi:hypothetical protein
VKITLTHSGFTATHRKKIWTIAFTEIKSVSAEKVGKITYDEVFLIIHHVSGDDLHLGELDNGFAALEHAFREQLRDFPQDWWAKAEAAPVGARNKVWTGLA